MIRKLVKQMLSAQIFSALAVSLCLLVDNIMIGRFYQEQGMAAYTQKVLAMDLYEKHHISLGHGAQLAGMAEEDFIYELGKAGISIFSFDSDEQFREELKNA